MFFSFSVFVFDDIDVRSAVHDAALILAIPAVVDAFAAENMLAVHHENVHLVLLDAGGCDRFENVVQPVAVRGEGVGDGE